jgi:hypothetical protein
VTASPQTRIIVFLDGDGADRADLTALLVEPIRGGYDFGASPGPVRRRSRRP